MAGILLDFIKKKQKIIVYGAGKIGRIAAGRFLAEGFEESVLAVAVTEKIHNPDYILGIPVVCINELTDMASETMVLIATMEDKHQVIRNHLLELGFHNICPIDESMYHLWTSDLIYRRYINPYLETAQHLCYEGCISKEEKENLEKEMLRGLGEGRGIDMPRLVTVLGTKCSLRCRECNNLMPLFKPQRDLEKGKILASLETVLGKVHTVLVCELIGGEPFLSEHLGDAIRLLAQKKNVIRIEITTNGTVLPEPSLIPLLQNSKVKVRISDYGELVAKDKIIGFLEENNINYCVLKLGQWISPGGTEKRNRSKEQLRKCYEACSSGYYCKTLFGEKIFSCARSASLSALGHMKKEEFLEVNADLSVEKMKEFLLKDYSEACDYCDTAGENIKYVKPAEQLRTGKEYRQKESGNGKTKSG